MGKRISGRQLGEFVVGERIGEGGSAVVYRGEQPALGREVVIKVLRGGRRVPDEAVQRFLREARLASRLDHPFAAHVYASGVEDDGLLWIAMEMVRGTPLDQVLRERGAFAASELAPLLVRLCEVVSAAHERGMVHRDIKPANVMVLDRSGQLMPKLLDFGIAKLAALPPDATPAPEGEERGPAGAEPGGDAPATGALTVDGASLGSPLYMAPEQWRSSDVDGRADIYALGVLAYEAIAGENPFSAPTVHEIARAHATRELPRLPKGVPRRLNDVLARAVAKDPEDRFDSAVALGKAFRAAAVDPRVVRRRRLMWAAAAAVVAGSIFAYSEISERRQRAREAACDRAGGALAGIWDEERKAEITSSLDVAGAAVRERHWKIIESLADERATQWTEARRASCLAAVRDEQSDELAAKREACLDQRLDELDALASLMTESVDDTSVLVSALRALPQVSRCEDLDRLALEPALPADAGARADMRRVRASIARAKVLSHTQHDERARDLATEAIDEAVELGRPEIEVQARVALARALSRVAPRDAVDAARAALRAAAVHGLDGALAEAALVLAESLNGIGVVDGAEDMAALAGALAERTLDDSIVATSHAIRGYIAISRSEHAEAIELLGPCVRLAASLESELDCRALRAAALVASGRIDEGVAEVDRALERLEPILAEQSAGTILYVWSSLCGVLVGAHQEERVVELTDRAVEIYERGRADGDPTLAKGARKLGMNNLHRGMALLQLGRVAEAVDVLEQAAEQLAGWTGLLHIIAIQRAEAHRQLGDDEAALAVIDELREADLGPQRAALDALEARVRLDRGELDAAAAALEAAAQGNTGEEADVEADLLVSRGRLALARGQRADARALLAKAAETFDRARNDRRAAEARALAADAR